MDEVELAVGEAGQEHRFGVGAFFAFDEVADLGEHRAGYAQRPAGRGEQSNACEVMVIVGI